VSCDLGGYVSLSRAIFAFLRESVLLVTSVFFFSFYYGRKGLGEPLPRGFVPLLKKGSAFSPFLATTTGVVHY